jgi:hypothetical protein
MHLCALREVSNSSLILLLLPFELLIGSSGRSSNWASVCGVWAFLAGLRVGMTRLIPSTRGCMLLFAVE